MVAGIFGFGFGSHSGTGTLAPDILALQEVDAPLDIPTCMDECGYQGHHTPTDITGRIGRVDACAIYFRRDRWTSIDVEIIRLDDLATLCTPPPTNQEPGNDGISTTTTISTSTTTPTTTRANSLIGIESSFLRKNMALLVRLQHVETGQDLVVAVAHLFWNPLYPDVKVRASSSSSSYVCVRGLEGSSSLITVLIFPVGSCVKPTTWRLGLIPLPEDLQ